MAKERNVYLIGHMGTGKTAVGRRLAKLLKRPFKDVDGIIEKRAGLRVSQIFERKGERAFRALELAAVRSVAERGGSVVALGGGAVTRKDVYRMVSDTGFVVRLTGDKRVLWSRLRKEAAKRPLLKGGRAAFFDLLEKRSRYPNGDVRVSTSRRTPEQVAVAVARVVKKRS